MSRIPAALALAAVLAGAASASADRLRLADGGVVRGRVTETADAVTIERGPLRVTYPRSLVAAIEREPSAADAYAARRTALAAKADATADAWAALGAWCAENDLPAEADEAYGRAITRDPAHERARRALGYRLLGGRWLAEDEYHAAIGEVRFRGRWVAREEMTAALEAEKAAREAEALADRLAAERQAVALEIRRRADEEARAEAEAQARLAAEGRRAALEAARRAEEERDAARRERITQRRAYLGASPWTDRSWGWPGGTVVVTPAWGPATPVIVTPAPACPPRPVGGTACRVRTACETPCATGTRPLTADERARLTACLNGVRFERTWGR